MSAKKPIPEKKKPGRPSERPDPDELIRFYKDHTSTQLAELYGTTPSTIRAWICKIRKERSEDE